MQKKPTRRPATAADSVKETTLPWKWFYYAVAALAVLLYINTIGHDFTVDDGTVMANNKFTTQGISGIPDLITKPYRAGFWSRSEGLYRPLSVVMFAVEWQITGGKPWLGHLINVLLYALTAALTLAVCRRLMRNMHSLIPLFITVLYILHPIHTEVVANIKSRDEILAFLFGMTALYSLLKRDETTEIKWMILSVCSFLLALFSKENAVTWMGVFPLTMWLVSKQPVRMIIRNSLPYLAAVAVFMLARYAVLNSVKGDYEILLINNSLIGATSASGQFATAVYILGKYLLLLLFPVTLIFDYSYNTIPLVSLSDFRFILSFLIHAFAVFYALKNLNKKPLISYSILFYVGTLVLVSNVFFLIEATMAERFLYTPSFGFCMLAGILLGKVLLRSDIPAEAISKSQFRLNRSFVYVAVLISVIFTGRSIARNLQWKDNITLLEADVHSAPESARIRYAYGSALLVERALPEKNTEKKNAYLDQAIEQLQKGVSILPNYNDAWYNLGLANKERGNAAAAVKAFEEARNYKAFVNADRFSSSGVAYGMAAQYDKAIADLTKATEMEPNDADHWNNLGLYLSEAGKINESITALNKAISLRKNFDKAWYNKGNAYAKANDYRSAIDCYKTALTMNSDYGDAYNNTGNCYAAMQKPDSARVWFEKAVQADPSNMKAVANLAITYRILGDSSNAAIWMEKARQMGAGL